MSNRASLTSALAKMYESTLDSAGGSGKFANRSSTTGGNNLTAMDKKLNLLDEKVDRLMHFQEDVMEKLDSLHQGIGGIERGIDKLTTRPAPADLRATESGGWYIDDVGYSQLRDICYEILKLMNCVHLDASKQREALEGVEKMVSTVDKVVTFMGETLKNSKIVDFILKGAVPWKKGSLAEIHHETKEKPEEKGAKLKHGLSTRGVQAEIRAAVDETKSGKRVDEYFGKCEKGNFGGPAPLNVDCSPPAEERRSAPQTIGASDKANSAETCQHQEDGSVRGNNTDRPCVKQVPRRNQDVSRDVNHVAPAPQKMWLEEYTPRKRVCGKSGDTEGVTPALSSSTPEEAVPRASRSATCCDVLCPSISSTLKKVDTQETLPVTKERASCDLADKRLTEKSPPWASVAAAGSGHLPGKFKHAPCHKDTRTETVEEANRVMSESKQDPQKPKAGTFQMRFHKSSTEGNLTEKLVQKCKNRPGTSEKEQKPGDMSLVKSCENAPRARKEGDSDAKGQKSEPDTACSGKALKGHTSEPDMACSGKAETEPDQCPDEPQDGMRQEDTNRTTGAQDFLVIDDSPPPPAPFGHRIVNVKQAPLTTCYSVCQDEVLGGGRFGQVHRCAETSSGLTLAAKIIKVKSAKDREEVKNEINVMNQLSHVNLIQLYDAFESKNSFTLIMEYVDGGELFDRIADETYNLTELDAILFTKQICEGVYYLHQQYILHLDLKPENILCVSHTGNQIKIIDFGLARRYKPREKLKINFGTPEFLAPEVVNYDFVSFPTDMWSIGVMTYMLLSGLSPFLGENDTETMNYIVNCSWDFNAEAFEQVSDEARHFISKLLVKEKSCRISAAQCLKHDWLNDLPAKAKKCQVRLKSQVQLQRYLAQRKWKKHFYVVTAANRLRKLQRMVVNSA